MKVIQSNQWDNQGPVPRSCSMAVLDSTPCAHLLEGSQLGLDLVAVLIPHPENQKIKQCFVF